jgi:hypothetical protein
MSANPSCVYCTDVYIVCTHMIYVHTYHRILIDLLCSIHVVQYVILSCYIWLLYCTLYVEVNVFFHSYT